MAATARVCPHCSSRLEPVAGQDRLRCRGCNKLFALAPSAPPPARTSAPATRTIALLTVGSALLLAVVLGGFLMMVLRGDGPEAAHSPTTERRAQETPPSPAPAPQTDSSEPGPSPPPSPPPQPVNNLTAEEQEEVNQAIDRGVAYLKSYSRGPGGWPGQPGVLPFVGLTLLECGVPADDPTVQKMVEAARRQAADLVNTYALSLTILFLDRLGNPEDEPLIHRLALRLIGGQNTAGGWTYTCPRLSEGDERLLTAYLEGREPARAAAPGGGAGRAREGSGVLLPVRIRPAGRDGGAMAAVDGGAGRTAAPGEAGAGRAAPPRREDLPPALRKLPVVAHVPGEKPAKAPSNDDNSNTQFATLGVWVARRHGVPVHATLTNLAARFHRTQNADGTWGYHLNTRLRPDSMTCAGLLGLAVGRVTDEGEEKSRDDPAIAKGLTYLGERVGKPGKVKRAKNSRAGRYIQADSLGDLYYLWSIERVAMLYNLSTLGGKDWYAWGASIIVDHQRDDGSWLDRHSPVPDTCFALLFLKRVNVAKDLTMHLQRVGPIRDPGESRTVHP